MVSSTSEDVYIYNVPNIVRKNDLKLGSRHGRISQSRVHTVYISSLSSFNSNDVISRFSIVP